MRQGQTIPASDPELYGVYKLVFACQDYSVREIIMYRKLHLECALLLFIISQTFVLDKQSINRQVYTG